MLAQKDFNTFTFPVIAWLVAGLVSSGGEWAVVGEPIARAVMQLGVLIGKAIIAYRHCRLVYK